MGLCADNRFKYVGYFRFVQHPNCVAKRYAVRGVCADNLLNDNDDWEFVQTEAPIDASLKLCASISLTSKTPQ